MADKRLALDQIPAIPGVANARGMKLMGSGESLVSLGATGGNIDVPGTTVVFSLETAQAVIVTVSCAGNQAQTANGAALLFYSIDAVDQPGPFNIVGTAGAVNNDVGANSISRAHMLTAGAHTIKARANNAGGPNNTILQPIVITVIATNEDLGGGGGSQAAGGSSSLVKVEASTVVPFVTASAVFIIVPGSTINFTLTEPKVVQLIAQFPCFGALGSFNYFDFGLKIDGVDVPVEKWRRGGSDNVEVPVDFSHVVSLLAGLHTISIIVRRASVISVNLPADILSPITLTALYTEPVFGVGSLASEEAENASGVATSNATAVYSVIPGTNVTFSFAEEKVALFEGFATAYDGGGSVTNAQLGVRVDGTDYDGTACYVSTSDDFRSLVVHKALTLLPGPHTAELVLRRANPDPQSAIVENGVTRPTRLTAIYTAPTASSLLLAEQFVDIVSGLFGTGAGYPGTAIPGALVNFVQSVAGDVIVHLDATSQFNGFFHDSSSTGLSLDAGVVERVGGTSNYGLGDGRIVYMGGTVVFPNVPAGPHTIQAFLYTNALGTLPPANVNRIPQVPLRIVVNHN